MSFKVIGAGLGRTGTASLKVALEQLGLGHCYHMTEVLHHPERTEDWINAAQGRPDWDKIFADYGASVDYPACTFWRELADYYPNAKVVLTVRDAGKWFESVNETIMSPDFRKFIANSPYGEMSQLTIYDTMDDRMDDREFMVSYFEDRIAEIIAAIPAERLLVYQVKEGWAPLCNFLDVPAPDAEFPRINSRDETKQLLAQLTGDSSGELTREAMAEVAGQLHEKRSD